MIFGKKERKFRQELEELRAHVLRLTCDLNSETDHLRIAASATQRLEEQLNEANKTIAEAAAKSATAPADWARFKSDYPAGRKVWYMGRELMVTGHDMEGVFGLESPPKPRMYVDYVDDHGVIHSKVFINPHLLFT